MHGVRRGQVATKFLHETGRLKYFGSHGRGEVYVSPTWGIQIFKGVMRDSRMALFRFLQRKPRDSPFKAECREQLDRLLRCLQVSPQPPSTPALASSFAPRLRLPCPPLPRHRPSPPLPKPPPCKLPSP
jgi:hypothetical protein